MERVYKIRDKTSGLFYSPGYPRWGRGRLYAERHHAARRITVIARYSSNPARKDELEVVEFELIEV